MCYCLSFTFTYVESQGLGQRCIAHKMVSSLPPVRLTLMSVCIIRMCVYVKCPFCCPILRSERVRKFRINFSCWMYAWNNIRNRQCIIVNCYTGAFVGICPTTTGIIRIGQIWWPIQPKTYVPFFHISRTDLLITRNRLLGLKLVEKNESRLCPVYVCPLFPS